MSFKFLVWNHRFHRSHGLLSQVVKVVFNLLPTDYVRLSRMSFNHRLHRSLFFLQDLENRRITPLFLLSRLSCMSFNHRLHGLCRLSRLFLLYRLSLLFVNSVAKLLKIYHMFARDALRYTKL